MCSKGKNGDLIEIHGHEVLKYGATMAEVEVSLNLCML